MFGTDSGKRSDCLNTLVVIFGKVRDNNAIEELNTTDLDEI